MLNRTRLNRHLAPLLLLALLGSTASAQPLPGTVPDGAVLPRNLEALGELMTDRVERMISEETPEPVELPGSGVPLDLFSGTGDEDPNLAEIRRIARELETQRSMILKLVELQSDLIEFGLRDPHAAYRSRIPVRVCELAIERSFCPQLSGSFQ